MMENKKTGFASGIGFVLAAAGSAVGLGNLWGFPYKTSANGGAAFVLVYIACVLVIGVIAMLCEVFIGRRAQANPVSAFKKVNKNFGWFGLLAIAIPAIIICYYSVLGGYTIKYSLNSFAGNAGKFVSFAGNVGEVILYTVIFLALSLFIVMAGVKGGIEKASKILMPALFVILLVIVGFSLCLGEGVSDGLAFYLNPDFSALDGAAILAAMGQAFFSLSLGMGAMITYGSYTGKGINLIKSTAMICIFDSLVALLAGLSIFPSLFHYMAVEGISASELGMGGIGLMFMTLPMVFEDMGVLGQVISFFFFAMVAIAAVTSVISLMEVVTQFVIQKFHILRKRATLVVTGICFAVSIPVGISLGYALNGTEALLIFGNNWLDFFDIVTNTVLMPVCALFACVAVGWLIGAEKATSEIEADGTSLGRFRPIFEVMVKYVTPILILVVEIFGLIDLIAPKNDAGVRIFSGNGLGIVLSAYLLLGICAGIYFLFFRNSYTGTNEDEKQTDSIEEKEEIEAIKEAYTREL